MSVGRYFLALVTVLLLGSCSRSVKPDNEAERIHGKPIDQLVPETELSLREDNEKLKELRKDVPKEKRIENDELADLMTYMGEVKYTPNQVREKFLRLLRKKRKAHRKALRKSRQTFSRNEKKAKDNFLNELKRKKKEFRKKEKLS